jgi:hypothetical protein
VEAQVLEKHDLLAAHVAHELLGRVADAVVGQQHPQWQAASET